VNRLPIRARLTAWYALFLALVLVAIGAFLVLKLRSDLRSTIDREVKTSSATIARNYRTEGIDGFGEISAAALLRTGTDAQVLGAKGVVVTSYGGDMAQDPMVPADRRKAAIAGTPQLFDLNLGDSPEPFRVMATAVTRGAHTQLVVVAESLQGVDEAVRKILILLLITGPVALAIAGLGGWLLVRNALVPVDRMRAKAAQIGIDRLHERLSAPHPTDELGLLASTLNAMLDRLEAGVGAKRQLVADASHELRAPLAAMRAELDVSITDSNRTEAERATLLSVREDVDRMSRIVDNLLTLASVDEGRLELFRGRVDLLQTIEEAARPLRPLADAKDIRIAITGEPFVAEADRQRLHQAVANLIENAIKFTPRGGEVTASTWSDNGELGVVVADTGPGIPPAARALVFDRFYRGDPSRSRASGGSGLGLAICSEIANAHGGTIRVQSEEGSGSTFTLALPAHPE
jgi:heavy metal sensor kinase